MANPQYNLGVFVGGTWRQWATASGQEYYENLNTRATQYEIPAGWEDAATVCIEQAFAEVSGADLFHRILG